MSLTKKMIDTATYQGTPTAKGSWSRCVLWDDEVRGFGVRVYPSGRKSFLLSYRAKGQKRLLTLGDYGVETLQQARNRARRLLAQVLEGQDPAGERAEARSAPTIAELAERYMDEHARPKKKPHSIEGDQRLLDLHVLPHLRSRRVRDVTLTDISDLHHKMRGTPTQANRALALLSKMFNLAERWGWRDLHSNPCSHIDRYREKPKGRYLSGEEIARLGDALTTAEGREHPSAVLALRLILFTGCRRNEILTLRWDEVDFDARCLRLSDSKTGSKVVPLGAPALELLANAEKALGNPHVCFGAHSGGHLVGLQRVWHRIRAAAGLEGVRIHDLRHSFASIGASAGMSLPMIGKLLGHSAPQTTARYAHLMPDPVAAAADRISNEIASSLLRRVGGKAAT